MFVVSSDDQSVMPSPYMVERTESCKLPSDLYVSAGVLESVRVRVRVRAHTHIINIFKKPCLISEWFTEKSLESVITKHLLESPVKN